MSNDRLPVVPSDRTTDTATVVPYPDQAMFLALRGADQEAAMQALWFYDQPVDRDGIVRFHRNLYNGLLGRRIETSPLPFGRHRWVAAPTAESNLDFGERTRPRAELFDWADEQVALPLDPEWGPAWRMAVQPFDDGSTVVSLAMTHCIVDGAGAVLSCIEAIHGVTRDLGYPPPRSRTRARAIRQDLRQLGRDLPEIGRTLVRFAKVAFSRRRELAQSAPAPAVAAGARQVAHVPSASIFIDVDQWDARAETLGGNNFSLAAGFAGKIAQNLNRVRASDGEVTLMIPVNDRGDFDDTGGNVVSIASVSFNPAQVTSDLTEPRNAIRDALKKAREVPDEMVELLPLIPFVPKRGIARMVNVAFGFTTDLPTSVSNLGDLPADLMRVDGTPAQYLCFRGVDRQVSRDTLDRRGGILTVAAGRVSGKVVISVISYQPGRENTQGDLRQVIAHTLAEFGLSGEIA